MKGIIKIYDTKSGELLFETHNDTMPFARWKIAKAIFNNTNIIKFKGLALSEDATSNSLTLNTGADINQDIITYNFATKNDSDMIYKCLWESSSINYPLEIISKDESNTQGVSFEDNMAKMSFSIKLTYKNMLNSPINVIGSLGLIGTLDGNDILISRATIPPYAKQIIAEDTEQTLVYDFYL